MTSTRLSLPCALFALFILTIGQVDADELQGVVVGVADGDTITVLDSHQQQHEIRLAGIDAPEKKQPFGQAAKQRMSDLVFKKEVRVDTRKTDRYGRTIGRVWTNSECRTSKCPAPIDAGLDMLARGLAWHYKQYEREQPKAERQTYAAAEDAAQARHVGLWRDREPMPPWNWRKRQK